MKTAGRAGKAAAIRQAAGHKKQRIQGSTAGRRQATQGRQGKRQGVQDEAKTGGFCTTYGRQNGRRTDTAPMRTRVYPVILYAQTVILGPEKPISQLRISEKKIGRKKMPRLARHKFPQWQLREI
jgi:hypothetical protein